MGLVDLELNNWVSAIAMTTDNGETIASISADIASLAHRNKPLTTGFRMEEVNVWAVILVVCTMAGGISLGHISLPFPTAVTAMIIHCRAENKVIMAANATTCGLG